MATSIVTIKRFTYRGDATEEFSNRYYLTGADPASPAEWLGLFTALTDAEKLIFPASTAIVGAYGYTDDSPTSSAVWSRDLRASGAIVGTFSTSPAADMPGDIVATVRWKTSRLTQKGKPIYLRKYYHDVKGDANGGDEVNTAHKTAYEAFATLLWDGAGVDSREIRGPGQTSETIVGSACSPWVTTRTLKRRGKRPTSP